MEKDFHINQDGCSICCKLSCADASAVDQVVLFGHGFGGHRDNRAAARFAAYLQSKRKGAAVITFDLPCHGSDVRRKLTLDDCIHYYALVVAYIRKRYPDAVLDAYATSFGGYLLLNYIAGAGNPFHRIALRCPAVNMYEVLTQTIMSPDDQKQLDAGKQVQVGFDRKIMIAKPFLDSLRAADIMALDFTPFARDILILHGTEDEVVPFAAGKAFAEKNGIRFCPMEHADHRFVDAAKMGEAIRIIADFLRGDR